MKIIVAFDSFKSSLSAARACNIVAHVLRDKLKDVTVIEKPLADGGEGTAAAIIAATDGQWIEKQVTGPLPHMKVNAGYAWLPNQKNAVVEMASASGLELLSPDKYNPMLTTTYGTGELIKAALEKNPDRILLAVGGSATVDGGIGAATALGFKFLDTNNHPVTPDGGHLLDIQKIIPPQLNDLPEIDVLCDATNPLTGPNGAARTYAPQKGATPKMVEVLEKGLEHLAKIVRKQLGIEIDVPHAGAAGGLAAGAIAFMNAKCVSGIQTILEAMNMTTEIQDADLIITGEGSFDSQSLSGKAISGLANLAKDHNVPLAVIAGTISIEKQQYQPLGIHHAIACKPHDMPLDQAMANAPALIAQAAAKLAEIINTK